MNSEIHRQRHAGFTLVEAVVALVILAAAAAGVLLIFAGPMAASADPQIRAQARAIASSYMDEIVLREYGTGTGDCGASEGQRGEYDNVGCYDWIVDEQPPVNQLGDEIPQLAAYQVDVTVEPGDGGARITVRVRHDSGRVDYELVSNRGNY